MKKAKTSAKVIFETKIVPLLKSSSSDEAIEKFCETSNAYFYNLPIMKALKERQIASIVGFKDEYFVESVINHVLKENNLVERFYCKKVTANATLGIEGRQVTKDGVSFSLMYGGDCVVFTKEDEKPILVIECKEYIDMIRMKELIGESRVIKDEVTNSVLKTPHVKFWVFAEVLELTDGWAYLFNNSDLKYKIDEVFIARKGKRKDKDNKPQKSELVRFRDAIQAFLATHQ